MAIEQPGYLVGNFTITDPQLMAEYGEQARPLVHRHGGVMTLMNHDLEPDEGEAQPVLVIIRFPTFEEARAFYQAPEYAPLKALRLKATTGGFLALVPGLE
ncbi:DUF1330 domain-containing protein [Pseudomonas vanderleydeniana]|uniref:DUF1330 domain-containing protein n=1 Tax=Pseudomonas vanderleydeniana TaxID=2745495 RepID=A0A9E6PKP5_9PSED|nr:DUF1330 domain-containing protein [Pseudomonas vanderleydeniana]QXI28552.1 DUF1330 domain-containing protein [Pseudomonas vanderleydeniana]